MTDPITRHAMPFRVCLLSAIVGLNSLALGEVEPWNQFRGPRGNGVAASAHLPESFDETNNVRWKTAVPGNGWSSPVVWQDQVWLTSGTKDGHELFAICVDADSGKIVHNVKVFDVADPSMEWSMNPHACPTPVVDGGRLFVHYGSYGTACLDAETADIVWRRDDLPCNHRVGPASSPLVSDSSVFLQFDGVDVQYVVALDKTSGETVWTRKRDVESDLATRLREAGLNEKSIKETLAKKPGDNRKSYASPTLITADGRQQLISPGAEVLFSYDPETGEELWRVEYEGWAWNVACRPVFANGLVYATNGLGRKLFAVKPDGRGDVSDSHVEWISDKGVPNMSSPVVVDGAVYMVGDKGGIVTCLDALSGERLWRKRLGGNHWASPIYANGKLFVSSKEGHVAVLAATKESAEVLSENKLNAEFIASPAVLGDSLVLRSKTHLYRIAEGFQRKVDKTEVASKSRKKDDKQEVAKKETSKKAKGKTDFDSRVAALGARLKELVKEGRLSEKDALELYTLVAEPKEGSGKKTVAEKKDADKKPADKKEAKKDRPIELEELGKKLKAAVDAGKMTREEAIAYYKEYAAKMKGGKGKGKGGKKGPNNSFYAIIIGRLKTKDIEVGEFTMEVDYVTSIYGDRKLKDTIMGKTVKVVGVSGPWIDKLLLLKRGDTLKLRSGTLDGTTISLSPKATVLERAAPFDPKTYPIPPESFRGFRGVVVGTIESKSDQGYDLTLRVSKVVSTLDGSRAKEPKSIEGRLMDMQGFYNQRFRAAFEDLVVGDTIRIGAAHRVPETDSLEATEKLELLDE